MRRRATRTAESMNRRSALRSAASVRPTATVTPATTRQRNHRVAVGTTWRMILRMRTLRGWGRRGRRGRRWSWGKRRRASQRVPSGPAPVLILDALTSAKKPAQQAAAASARNRPDRQVLGAETGAARVVYTAPWNMGLSCMCMHHHHGEIYPVSLYRIYSLTTRVSAAALRGDLALAGDGHA